MGWNRWMKTKYKACAFAILAAALYAVNVPISKLLMTQIGSTMMAGLLYLGAGIGMFLYVEAAKAAGKRSKKEPLTKKELPFTVAMVVLDIIAPILLMTGIANTASANVSLLNNFEIVATSLIALVIFKETISKRLWIAIGLVVISSIILSFEGAGAFSFSKGSLFVLGACICWGFENNCTKMISNKSSEEIVIIKGIFSGLGSLTVAFLVGETLPAFIWILSAMALGFISYGLSINFYIMAQKDLGAAKTSAFYSVAPFFGVAFSLLILGERPGGQFYVALVVMIAATMLMVQDTIALQHTHEHTHVHTHEHSHGDLVHTHEHSHTHTHMHTHGAEEEQHTHHHSVLENHDHVHEGEFFTLFL